MKGLNRYWYICLQCGLIIGVKSDKRGRRKCPECKWAMLPIPPSPDYPKTQPMTRIISERDRKFCPKCGSGMKRAKWWHLKPTVCRRGCKDGLRTDAVIADEIHDYKEGVIDG
jgi:DNA-directed RNA polymerase subunit RPC12/RpoP